MDFDLTFAELVAVGADRRGAALLEQAGATLGVARADGAPLEELLDEGFLSDVDEARAAVEAARLDKEIVTAEGEDLTRGQDEVVRRAKVWRRKAVARCTQKGRANKAIPAELKRIGGARTVPALLDQIGSMTALMRVHLAALGKGADVLVAAGEAVAAELREANDLQETARLAERPQKVQEYYAAKGRLYLGLKAINDAGKELWADDPVQAARYNLKILYRRAAAAKPVEGGGEQGGGETDAEA